MQQVGYHNNKMVMVKFKYTNWFLVSPLRLMQQMAGDGYVQYQYKRM